MLPLHRLAQSTSTPSQLESVVIWVKSHPVWSSRLATRAAGIFVAFAFTLWWLSPQIFGPPPQAMHDIVSPPPVGNPILRLDLPPQVWDERASKVKEMFIYAYHGYEAAAFGADELLPLANKSTQKYVPLS